MSIRESFRTGIETLCESEGWVFAADQVEIEFESGRRQCVKFQDVDFEGELLARFFSVIGDSSRIDPMRLTQALRVSFGLPHGALAIHGDDLVIVDTLRQDHAEADEIRAVVRYLAEMADHFESTMFGIDDH